MCMFYFLRFLFYPHFFPCIHIWIYAECMHLPVHMHVCVRMYVCTYAYMRVYVCVRIYVRIDVHFHVVKIWVTKL